MTSQKNKLSATDDVSLPTRRKFSVIYRNVVVLLYQGDDGGVGGGVQCGGADQDDTKQGVASEVHRAKVVGGTVNGLKEHGDELAGGEEGAEVEPVEELEEDVVAKDVGEGHWGQVVVNDEVGIGDNKNGEGGAVREIRSDGRGGGEEGGEQG